MDETGEDRQARVPSAGEAAVRGVDPRVRALDDPPTAVPPELPAVLVPVLPRPEVGRDQVDAPPLQSVVEGPAVVRPVPYEERRIRLRTAGSR